MGLEGFQLLSGSVITVIEGVCVFLCVIGDRRYTRVFELLAHLGIRACSAILPRGLYCRNLLLLEGPSCLSVTAFHKVFVEFLFRSSRDFQGRIVGVNKNVNNLVLKASCPSKKSRKDSNIRGTCK